MAQKKAAVFLCECVCLNWTLKGRNRLLDNLLLVSKTTGSIPYWGNLKKINKKPMQGWGSSTPGEHLTCCFKVQRENTLNLCISGFFVPDC